jgi:hypothetical protein
MISSSSRVVGVSFWGVLWRLLEGGLSGKSSNPIDDNDSVTGDAYESATPRDTVLSVSACSAHAMSVLRDGPGRSETPSSAVFFGVIKWSST